MREQEPSRTALGVAIHRAVHQVLERGAVFTDPLALRILGTTARRIEEDAAGHASSRGIRFFVSARSRFSETKAAEGVEQRGVRQLVVLGAGYDTFAYRHPFAGRLKVFEVDFPATQAWKRRRLEEAGIAIPEDVVFAPVDFERDRLLDGLVEAGLDPKRRTFFAWLGVVPYLTAAAIDSTLAMMAGLPGGAEVVFDYSDPPATLSGEVLAAHRERAARVAALGEPFLSYFEPAELRAKLAAFGFANIEDLNLPALAARYLGAPGADDRRPLPERGGHVIFAAMPQTAEGTVT